MTTFLTPHSDHGQDHVSLLDQVQSTLQKHRHLLGLDQAWVIEPRIACQQEMPLYEGSTWWDAGILYARMMFRCDLGMSLLLFVTVHELIELLLWETADLFITSLKNGHLPKKLYEVFRQQYLDARNREIERLTTRHLGYSRPGHLAETIYLPASPNVAL